MREWNKNNLYYSLSEVSRCLLCHEPPCENVCPRQVPVGKILRSLYLDNWLGFSSSECEPCSDCDAPCEKACVLSDEKAPVRIREILNTCHDKIYPELPKAVIDDVDISCDICGVKLENPFLLSSSVVASSLDMLRRAFDAGWAGAAFKTICTFDQHEASPRFSAVRRHSHSFFGFKNIEQLSDHSVEENMEVFRILRKEYPTKVIVASIMGCNEEEWTMLASHCEEAGASVIECNFSCPNMEDDSLGVTIGQSEELVERFTRAVRRGTKLPVLVKLTPNVADMVPLALAAKRGGADGIAAINTINSVTGVNLDTLVAEPSVQGKSMVGGYSGAAVKPIALRFISDLASCKELDGLHISGMGGIETWRDAMEFILMGAGSVQVTTAVMQYGYRIIDDLIEGMRQYMRVKGFSSVRSMVEKSAPTVVPHTSIERDTIVYPMIHADKCCGCGRCYISCMDGGHQAIAFDPQTRIPRLEGRKCVGCHLCILVCPVYAIEPAPKAVRKKVSSDRRDQKQS